MEVEYSGYTGIEVRAFENAPLYSGQDGAASASFVVEPEVYVEWQNEDLAFMFTPYFRRDSSDAERSLVDVRELLLQWVKGNWEWKVGVSKVFWGVTESQHLVDVINQTDLAANLDGEDKLGQPMVNLTYVSKVGNIGLFILPYFRERTFPGVAGRFRGSLSVDTDYPLFQSESEARHLDFAARWKHYVGDYDFGISYFRGTNRDPLLALFEEGTEAKLRPYYEQMEQVSLDLQLTRGGWLWKLEALGRETDSDRFSAAVGGFEYTLYGLGGSALDLGILAEGHLDSRGENAPVPFNRDLFLGGRLTWNDEADTSLIAGAFVDTYNGSVSGRIEYERRLWQNYKLEVEVQKFASVAGDDPLYSVRRDSYLQVGLNRFF